MKQKRRLRTAACVLLAGTVFSFRVQAEECELYALSAVFQRGEDKV